MNENNVLKIRELTQKYAYSSIQMHEAIARKAGFSSTDHKYLGFFLQRGKMTAGELAELTGLTTGAVTGLIDRFEKAQLVKRQYDKSDRRKVIVDPDTIKIFTLLEPFYKEFQDESENIISSFSCNEREIIESYFLKALALADITISKFK